MIKKMSEIEFETTKDRVSISQANISLKSGKDVIAITKDQIDLLIKWLEEARDEKI